ncbi:MAG: hypothetical protein H7839_14520 [Magnetococcus sp. YQC-5]
MKIRTSKVSCAGFTLLEMVLTTTMVALSWSMFAPLLSTSFNAFGTNMAIRETVNRSRPAMQRIRMELLNANTVPIISGSSMTFTFTESPSDVTVTYDLAGGYLRRNNVNMVEGVTNLTFSLTQAGASPNIMYTVTTDMTVAWMGVTLPLRSSVLLRKLLPCV